MNKDSIALALLCAFIGGNLHGAHTAPAPDQTKNQKAVPSQPGTSSTRALDANKSTHSATASSSCADNDTASENKKAELSHKIFLALEFENRTESTKKQRDLNARSEVQECLKLAGDSAQEILNRRDTNNQTPFHKAIENELVRTAVFLRKNGSEIDTQANSGRRETPFHTALQCLPAADIKMILPSLIGTNKSKKSLPPQTGINRQDTEGDTPLHLFFKSDSYRTENLLPKFMKTRPDVSIRNQNNQTSLHLATEDWIRFPELDGTHPVISAVVNQGTNKEHAINVQDNNGNTPLHLAAQRSEQEAIQKLLEIANADPTIHNQRGQTPLHIAAGTPIDTNIHNEDDCANKIDALLRAGANLEARDNAGNTPLHFAASTGAHYLVQALLRNGAKIDQRNNAGLTALDIATARQPLIVREGKRESFNETIKTLLRAGSDPNTTDDQGNSPFCNALRNPYITPTTCNEFLSRGGRIVQAIPAGSNIQEATPQPPHTLPYYQRGTQWNILPARQERPHVLQAARRKLNRSISAALTRYVLPYVSSDNLTHLSRPCDLPRHVMEGKASCQELEALVLNIAHQRDSSTMETIRESLSSLREHHLKPAITQQTGIPQETKAHYKALDKHFEQLEKAINGWSLYNYTHACLTTLTHHDRSPVTNTELLKHNAKNLYELLQTYIQAPNNEGVVYVTLIKTLQKALNEEHTLPNQTTHTPHNTTNSTEQHSQKLLIQESKKRTFHTIKELVEKHLANVKKEIAEINQTTEKHKQEAINTITHRHKELLQKELNTLVQQGHISAEIARRVAQPACQLIDFPGQTKMDDTYLHQFEKLCARWSQLNHWKPSIDNVLKAIALGTKQKELHKLTSHEARAPHASAITSATGAAQSSNRTHTSKDKGKALSSSNASGKKKANAVEPSAKHRKRASHSNNQRNSPEEDTQQLPEEIVAEILKYIPLNSRSK